jgi:uncharacterized protein YjiK
MFSVEGFLITLSRGDTGSVTINASGHTFTAADRALFTVKNNKGNVVKQSVYPIEDGQITVYFSNDDTDDLAAGNYTWDVRYIINPMYDTDEQGNQVIVDGAQVITPMTPQRLTLLDTVGQI